MVEYQIILDDKWNISKDLLKQSVKIISEPKEVKEPINLFHKIKKKLGLKYREEVVGYYYKIEFK